MQTESRRDRLRAATVREITQTARRILVEEGPDAVTLRAIAREMGMTAPALYRYFDSHQELLRHLVGELFTELTDHVEAAIRGVPGGNLKARFGCAAAAFRDWSLTHRREYVLLFGTPLPGVSSRAGGTPVDDYAAQCARRFGRTFIELFLELWAKHPFPIPPDDEVDPSLARQLTAYREHVGAPELPMGAMVVFLTSWIRLQGFVTLEVFQHLDFALADSSPMFDLLLHDLADRLGLSHDL
jgi:AcrR family transcriptional regulator